MRPIDIMVEDGRAKCGSPFAMRSCTNLSCPGIVISSFVEHKTHLPVIRSFVFPLSSLMLHGIVMGAAGESRVAELNTLDPDNPSDFSDEVWTYFSMGVMLQELYIRQVSSIWHH